MILLHLIRRFWTWLMMHHCIDGDPSCTRDNLCDECNEWRDL